MTLIDEIKERREKVTGHGWLYDALNERVMPHVGPSICDLDKLHQHDNDGYFIAHAPADIDYLLAELARLTAEKAALKAQVEFDKGDRADLVAAMDKQAEQIKRLLRIKDETADYLAKE